MSDELLAEALRASQGAPIAEFRTHLARLGLQIVPFTEPRLDVKDLVALIQLRNQLILAEAEYEESQEVAQALIVALTEAINVLRLGATDELRASQALQELVRLNDSPDDPTKAARFPVAWQAARDLLDLAPAPESYLVRIQDHIDAHPQWEPALSVTSGGFRGNGWFIRLAYEQYGDPGNFIDTYMDGHSDTSFAEAADRAAQKIWEVIA